MADISKPPRESFRLSQLLYDARFTLADDPGHRGHPVGCSLLAELVNNCGRQPGRPGQGYQVLLPVVDRRLRHQPAPHFLYIARLRIPRGTRGHPSTRFFVAFLGCILATVNRRRRRRAAPVQQLARRAHHDILCRGDAQHARC